MLDAIKRNKGQVLAYLFTSCKNTLIKRYPFMLQCTLMEEVDSFTNVSHKITDLLKNAEGTTVFLDSIDIISLDSSFDRVIVLLKKISREFFYDRFLKHININEHKEPNVTLLFSLILRKSTWFLRILCIWSIS